MSLTIPDGVIDGRAKGFVQPGRPSSDADVAAARHSLFGGSFTWTVMVARRSALEHGVDGDHTVVDLIRTYF